MSRKNCTMECTIVNIVSPSIFWVVEKNADDYVIKQLELLMEEEIRSGSMPRMSVDDNKTKYVAVEVKDRKYRRGSICRKKTHLYEVFLIDYGELVEVENSKLYPLPDCASNPEPLAFKVHLYGTFPATKMFDGSEKRKFTNDWSPETKEEITKFLSKNPDIIVTEKEKGDNVIYADILIKVEDKSYSLRRLLVTRFEGVYHEKTFIDRVIKSEKGSSIALSITSPKSTLSYGSASSCNSEIHENVQKVEKWQKKNDDYKQEERVSPSTVQKHSVGKAGPSGSTSSNSSIGRKLKALSSTMAPRESSSTVQQLSVEKARPSGSTGGNSSIGSQLEALSITPPKEVASSTDSRRRCMDLIKRLSRTSNCSVKSEASTSSSTKQLETEINSKCSDSSGNDLSYVRSESAKALSSGESSKIELKVNRGEVDVSDDPAKLFESDMPLKASDNNVQEESIFAELLKDQRDKKNDDLVFVPAGKMLTSNCPKKPLKPRAFMSGRSDSGHSQSSQSSEKKNQDVKSENKVIQEVKPPKMSSLKDVPIRKPFSEKNTATSDIVRIPHNRPKRGILETILKNRCYWPNQVHEGILTENTFKKIPLDRPLVLASDSVPEIEAEEKFDNLKVSGEIIKNLQKHGRYETLSSIQKHSINALRRNLNTVMISGAKTGKTLSYIIPLIDFVLDKSNFEDLPDGNGPVVVILCSSSKSAQDVYEWCHKLLNNRSDFQRERSKVQVHLAHGGGAEKEMWVSLTNGCDILISTPHCLARLVECPLITNFERLCCLVIDEADVITNDPYISELLTILKLADSSTHSRDSMKNYQKVICSKRWTPEVAQLVKSIMIEHVIIFANFLEAAVYAKLKPHLSLVFNELKKIDVLFDKVGDKFGKEKILIMCEVSKDVSMIKDEIEKRKKCIPIIAHEGMIAEDIDEAAKAWKSPQQKPILICTDSVLHDLKIDNAEVLVHYSLPYKYKANFGYRFSTLVKNYKNLQSENKEAKNLQVYCLIDEFNHYQLPHIVELSQRLGGKISQAVLDKCEEIKMKREMAKESRSLCFDMLEFGKCKNFKSCPRRHAFNPKLDAPLKSQPTVGKVSFMVLTVHDACHFSARILEHIDVNDVKTPLHNDYLMISLKLAKHFKNEENWIPHGIPKVGDICTVKDEKNNFHRAQIIEWAKVDQHDQPIEVHVQLMDKGDVLTKKNLDLYEIPKELVDFPPQAVDIVLCGLLPMDFDSNWGRPSTDKTRELLMDRRLKENEKWMGRIVLSLNNILCLDPVELCEHLSIVNVEINKFSLGERLTKDNLAVFNENHLKMLYELCEKGGISVPKYKQKKMNESNVKPRWAFFDKLFEKVHFRNAVDTSSLFVILTKFRDLVKNLEDECNVEANKILQRKDRPKFDVRIGKVCMAYYKEDGTWNRATIQEQKGDEICIFFVDHGDCSWIEKCDLLPIPDRLIAKLPFQAIECSLIGIDHETSRLEDKLDLIYDFSHDGCDLLYVNVIKDDLTPTLTGGKKYEVNLFNDGKSLSKMLVDEKLARPLESQKNHLVDIEITLSDNEEENRDDDDEEIWEDEIKNSSDENDKIAEKNKLNLVNNNNEEIIRNDEEEEKNKDEDRIWTSEQIEAMLETDEEANGFFQDLSGKEFARRGMAAPRIFELVKKNKAITEAEKAPDAISESRKPPKISKLKQLLKLDKHKKEVKPDIKEKIVEVTRIPQILKIPLVVLPERIFTPDVHWIQNHSDVNLRIELINVQKYRLHVKCNKILFGCNLNGKDYALELRLFGAVCPKMTEVQVKAFYVDVTLKKLCSDFWPRLVIDKIKYPNIHLDAERIPEFNKKSYVHMMTEEVEKKLKSGIKVKPIKYKTILPVDNTDSEDDYENDDESNDSDPYDCLAV